MPPPLSVRACECRRTAAILFSASTKSSVAVSQNKLPDRETATRLKQYWSDKLDALGDVLSELPVNYSGSRQPTYDDLFYLDISLLNAQVRSTGDGTREISWNSVSNLVNYVEFTTNLPPVWQTVVSTNGTGDTLSVVDSNSAGAQRFYRVRVDY